MSWASTPCSDTAWRPAPARPRIVCLGTTDSRAASVPQSEEASAATTRSRRRAASSDPATATVVVLPTPPLTLTTSTRRQPPIGAAIRLVSSRSRALDRPLATPASADNPVPRPLRRPPASGATSDGGTAGPG